MYDPPAPPEDQPLAGPHPDQDPTPPVPPTSPGHLAEPAWVTQSASSRRFLLAIVAVALVIVTAVVQRLPEGKPKAAPAQTSVLLEGSDEASIIGRLFVKFAHALPKEDRGAMSASLSQVDLAARTPVDRLRAAIVYGELVGADAAMERLKKLRELPAPDAPTTPPAQPETPAGTSPADSQSGAGDASPDLTADLDALELIYSDKASELTTEQKDSLATRHGWFGRLALTFGTPDTDAARSPLLAGGLGLISLFMAFGLLALCAAIAGFVLFIVAMAMFGSGRIRARFRAQAPGGTVYLETFTIFLGSFLALALIGSLLAMVVPEGSAWLKVALLAAHWLLVAVLFYPLARGVNWSELRTGLGWTSGRGVVAEIGAGIVGYLAGLPVFLGGVVLALIAFVVQSKITGVQEPPKNPLFERLASGGPTMLVVFFVMATLWAPLVEEGVFRGSLYRHLRGRLHPVLAGMGSAFAFGIIHPVPLVLTIPLMALGFNFAMIREWRGSLIGPMTAHCLHNATVLGLLLSVLSLVGD